MSDNKATLSAFREEVSAWMSENVPSDPGFLLPLTFLEVGTEQQLDFLREWQHKLWSQCVDDRPLRRLETLRRHLLGFVQPRLAWEVALLELVA